MSAPIAEIRLIVGLGNPGADYANTRHNAGFWLIDSIARHFSQSFRLEKRFNLATSCIHADGKDIYLIKPLTFMNRSGQAVGAMTRYYRFKPCQILVLHDELDLQPGDNRLKLGGGHGGHNGLRDVMTHLGDRDFFRLRIGIGHPGDRHQVVNYVLHPPSVAGRGSIDMANARTLDIMPLVFTGQIDKAMQALHTEKI